MQLLEDLHHLAFVTADLTRLIAFYERVFDARTVLELEEEGLRHAFIEVGSHTLLHPFEIPGVEVPGREEMFQRGRLDHFALRAASEDAFWELRRRIVADGAGDGTVLHMGAILTVSYTDPDGAEHEVCWATPDGMAAGRKRADWTVVPPPGR